MPRKKQFAKEYAMKDFGFYLKDRRKRLGMTQGDLAEKLGITQQAVSDMESNVESIGIGRFFELSRILNFDIVQILRVSGKTMADLREYVKENL